MRRYGNEEATYRFKLSDRPAAAEGKLALPDRDWRVPSILRCGGKVQEGRHWGFVINEDETPARGECLQQWRWTLATADETRGRRVAELERRKGRERALGNGTRGILNQIDRRGERLRNRKSSHVRQALQSTLCIARGANK
ncbi:hypothetical protein BKA56DRAFT_226884 [Ilyonectria sp. MPI-CAGE-AT-0026]|nr:hypothetical protein BKA56DRAFT_226884 [Ilyonectria sp. MPI-CAGE-AT-0026]